MRFWIIMFIYNLLIPSVMIIAGYLMYRHIPKNKNKIYGYRTSRAMKSMDTWKFAHDYCGRLWCKAGAILLILAVMVQIPFRNSTENIVEDIALLINVSQLCVLIATIFKVEKMLKQVFDDQGQRK